MTLEDIIEIFGMLDGLSNMRDARAAEYGLICEEYLTHLKICFTDVSDSQKQTWYSSTKIRLIAELQRLKNDAAFNRYSTLIDSMKTDVEENGAIMQSLFSQDEIQQLIDQLNSTINISTDILYDDEKLDDLTEIFDQLEQVAENFENKEWHNVIIIFRRLRVHVQSHGVNSLTEIQHQKLAQYQKLYILAMSAEATACTTIEKTLTKFHEALSETHNLFSTDNHLITACLIEALKRIAETEGGMPDFSSATTASLLTDLIVLAIAQQKILPAAELANLILIFQLKLIDTLIEMPSTSQESLIKNLLLAHRLLLNYINMSGDKQKITTLYAIQTKLYEHLKGFALSAHPPASILNYLQKIISRNNLISPGGPLWVEPLIWIAHQRKYLIELAAGIKTLGLKLDYQQNILLLETLLEQHKTIPTELATSLDKHRLLACQEDLAIAWYFYGIELDKAEQFDQSNQLYERALATLFSLEHRSVIANNLIKSVTFKWIIALAKCGLQHAIINGTISTVAQQKINRAVAENNSAIGHAILDAPHQSQFSKILYDYAGKVYNGTPIKLAAMPYYQFAAAEINKLNFNSCSPTIQGQIKTYNECFSTMAYNICEKFTDLDLCGHKNLLLLTSVIVKYPQQLSAQFSKAAHINSSAFVSFAQEFKNFGPANTFIGHLRSKSIESQEIAAHFNHVIANPTLEFFQSFRNYIIELERHNPKSVFMPSLTKVLMSLENLIVLNNCMPQQTQQLRITG